MRRYVLLAMVILLATAVAAKRPAHASELAPGVFYLGPARDVDGRIVEGFAFERYDRSNAKPPWAGGGNDKGQTQCFEVLSRSMRWKVTEGYLLNPANNDLPQSTVVQRTEESMAEWEAQTDFELFGPRGTEAVDGIDTKSTDGKNEILFGSYAEPGVIAVTYTWGIYGGPPKDREIVEFDMLFNDAGFTFADGAVAGTMDFASIMTHELGHAIGLGHPDSTCTEETMYAYADYAETKKRSLEAGDIAGVQELYG